MQIKEAEFKLCWKPRFFSQLWVLDSFWYIGIYNQKYRIELNLIYLKSLSTLFSIQKWFLRGESDQFYHWLFLTLFDQEGPMIKNGDKTSSKLFETTSNRFFDPNIFIGWKKLDWIIFCFSLFLNKRSPWSRLESKTNTDDFEVTSNLFLDPKWVDWFTYPQKVPVRIAHGQHFFLDSYRETTFVP